MIILSLYGVTTGLELVQIPLSNIPSSLKFENAWIEITERQILTSSEKDSFVIFRKIIGSNIVTWIGLYRPAFEIGGNRSGGFYGAGAWIVDCVTDVRVLVEVLKDLADQIQSTSMNDGRFIKRIADSQNEIKLPSLVSSLNTNLSKVAGGCHPLGDIALIVSNGNVNEIIDWSQRAKSAYAFSKIFVVSAEQLPGQSNQTSFAVHRSLSLAIESAYNRIANDLQATRNELAATNQELNKSKQEESNLISDIHKLEFTLSSYNQNASNFNVEVDRLKKNYEQTIFGLNAEIATLKNKIYYGQQKISQLENEFVLQKKDILQNRYVEIQANTDIERINPQRNVTKNSTPSNDDMNSEEVFDSGNSRLIFIIFIGLSLALAIIFAIYHYKNGTKECNSPLPECAKFDRSTPAFPAEAPSISPANTINENDSKSSIENPVVSGTNKTSLKVDPLIPETKNSNSAKNQSSQDQKDSDANVVSSKSHENQNKKKSDTKNANEINNKTSGKNRQ